MTFDLASYNFYQKLTQLDFVEKIILFGSRATSSFRPDSDIDIAIQAAKADVLEWQMVLDIVEDADTLLKIDCVRIDKLSNHSELRRNIESNGKILYAKYEN
jgi:predicted nucleotidyltransferase